MEKQRQESILLLCVRCTRLSKSDHFTLFFSSRSRKMLIIPPWFASPSLCFKAGFYEYLNQDIMNILFFTVHGTFFILFSRSSFFLFLLHFVVYRLLTTIVMLPELSEKKTTNKTIFNHDQSNINFSDSAQNNSLVQHIKVLKSLQKTKFQLNTTSLATSPGNIVENHC